MNNNENIILAKLQQALSLLNEVDDAFENNPTMQQNIDWEISDYLHIIEDNRDLSNQSKIEINDCIERCRVKRRELCHIQAVGKVYNDNKNKLVHRQAREQLSFLIGKTLKNMDTQYKYRVLDDDTVNKLICSKDAPTIDTNNSKKQGKKPCITKEEMEERINKGMKMVDIAREFGVSQANISILKKKYGLSKKRG